MSRPKIVIVDYGMGNLKSVMNALAFLGCDAAIIDKPGDLESAEAVILPGVGAFGEAMANLRSSGFIDPLRREVLERRKPFLGICLGMQLIARSSEEGGVHEGLGWLPGDVKRLAAPGGLRLPHVGWNEVRVVKRQPLFERIDGPHDFYFVHTYRMVCGPEYVAAESAYGEDFVAAVQMDNVYAVQFHPEKSQTNGLRLLRNFAALTRSAAEVR